MQLVTKKFKLYFFKKIVYNIKSRKEPQMQIELNGEMVTIRKPTGGPVFDITLSELEEVTRQVEAKKKQKQKK